MGIVADSSRLRGETPHTGRMPKLVVLVEAAASLSVIGKCDLTAWDILPELIQYMSKCHVKELQNLWEAILTDASHAFPTLRDEFERDLARLQRIVAHRGIRVFLEDLPAIGKHLDRCLSCGQYKLSGLPLTKRYSNTVVIPKFLRGLYLLVFHDSGRLKEDCDVEALFFVRQLTFAFKKGKLACSDRANENEVVEFYSVDSGLPEPEKFWETEDCAKQSDQVDCGIQYTTSARDDSSRHSGFIPECQEVTQTRAACLDHQASPGGRCEEGSGGNPQGLLSKTSTLARGGLAYEGFIRSALYQGRVESMPSQKRRRLSSLLARLDFVSSLVTATLGSYDPSVWRFRHGPGAVSEYRGPANKYCWTNWSDTLESEYPIADCGYHSYSSWADRVRTGRDISSRELCSRMVCVPKTYSKPRLIAAEPSSYQWCQQNLWHYFRKRVRRTWIGRFVRFNDQTLNQSLCKLGSRNGTLATIDLSAASDRVTCHIVGQMFRANPRLLNCLRASRTQTVSQDVTDKVPQEIRLRKFSTMGNACTFPVQSLLFLSIAIASVLTQRNKRCTVGNVKQLIGEVSIFGDDIIIPIDSRELFVEALEVLDFKVNAHKSFWTGMFRESCGVDAFRGVDITPAYWRTFNNGKPESLASTVETRNNFYKKFLLTAADRLASTIPRDIPKVHMSSGVFGLKSLLGPDLRGFKHRDNPALQRTEVRVLSLISSQQRLPIKDDSALLQYFTEDPDPFTKWISGIPQRPRTRIRPRWVALTDMDAPCVVSN